MHTHLADRFGALRVRSERSQPRVRLRRRLLRLDGGAIVSVRSHFVRRRSHVARVSGAFFSLAWHFLETIPLRRLARPEEVAEAVLFLVEEGDYFCGQVISPNAGTVI